MKTEQVIIELAKNHPEIAEFMFCVYEPGRNSDTADYNPPHHTFWVPTRYLLLDSSFLSTLKQTCIRKEEGYEYEALGIASRTRTGGKQHLTLVDFCCEIFNLEPQ